MSAKRIDHARKRKRPSVRKKPTSISKSLRRSSTRRSNSHLDFIDAAARVLGLAIEPAWKPAVAANLEATLRLAALFVDFPLPDEAEPAPIFVA
jgi:1-carboxybiuret hydrolase subunit AtzG-like protein